MRYLIARGKIVLLPVFGMCRTIHRFQLLRGGILDINDNKQ